MLKISVNRVTQEQNEAKVKESTLLRRWKIFIWDNCQVFMGYLFANFSEMGDFYLSIDKYKRAARKQTLKFSGNRADE